MATDLDKTFAAALVYVKNFGTVFAQKDKRCFYGLEQQVFVGDCTEPAPDKSDLEAVQRWGSWTFFKGLNRDRAKQIFISSVSKISPSFNPEIILKNNIEDVQQYLQKIKLSEETGAVQAPTSTEESFEKHKKKKKLKKSSQMKGLSAIISTKIISKEPSVNKSSETKKKKNDPLRQVEKSDSKKSSENEILSKKSSNVADELHNELKAKLSELDLQNKASETIKPILVEQPTGNDTEPKKSNKVYIKSSNNKENPKVAAGFTFIHNSADAQKQDNLEEGKIITEKGLVIKYVPKRVKSRSINVSLIDTGEVEKMEEEEDQHEEEVRLRVNKVAEVLYNEHHDESGEEDEAVQAHPPAIETLHRKAKSYADSNGAPNISVAHLYHYDIEENPPPVPPKELSRRSLRNLSKTPSEKAMDELVGDTEPEISNPDRKLMMRRAKMSIDKARLSFNTSLAEPVEPVESNDEVVDDALQEFKKAKKHSSSHRFSVSAIHRKSNLKKSLFETVKDDDNNFGYLDEIPIPPPVPEFPMRLSRLMLDEEKRHPNNVSSRQNESPAKPEKLALDLARLSLEKTPRYEFMQRLSRRSGENPSSDQADKIERVDLLERVQRFYQLNDSSRLKTGIGHIVDWGLKKGVDLLNKKLREKYGNDLDTMEHKAQQMQDSMALDLSHENENLPNLESSKVRNSVTAKVTAPDEVVQSPGLTASIDHFLNDEYVNKHKSDFAKTEYTRPYSVDREEEQKDSSARGIKLTETKQVLRAVEIEEVKADVTNVGRNTAELGADGKPKRKSPTDKAPTERVSYDKIKANSKSNLNNFKRHKLQKQDTTPQTEIVDIFPTDEENSRMMKQREQKPKFVNIKNKASKSKNKLNGLNPEQDKEREFKRRLVEFLLQYEPDNIDKYLYLLTKHKTKYGLTELNKKLLIHYGDNLADLEEAHQKEQFAGVDGVARVDRTGSFMDMSDKDAEMLSLFFAKYDPKFLAEESIERVYEWADRNGMASLNRRLKKRYNEDLDDFMFATQKLRHELVEFYMLVDRSKLATNLDAILTWTVINGRDALNDNLRQKYGHNLDSPTKDLRKSARKSFINF